MKKYSVRLLFCGLPVLAMLLTSCSESSSGQNANKSGQSGGGSAVPVLAAEATNRDVPVEIEGVGTVQAYSTVSIRSQITDSIYKVHLMEGDEVKSNDLLFTLDPRPFDAALNQAEANLKRDQAQLVNARVSFERISNLLASKIESQSDYDAAEATYQSAESTVVADAAAITNAQVNLSYTAIRAPIDGRTGNLNVKEGNVVKSPDDVLVTMTQVRPIYVAFAVPEQYLPAIRHRAAEAVLPVTAVAPSATNELARGSLSFIDNAVDTNSGTILLKGTFSNLDTILWPGQFVQATLTLSNLSGALVVPTQAIQSGQSGEFVFVVKPDETVEARPVAAGITYDGLRVINSGLKSGETVVTDGQLRLRPGTKVAVKAPETETNSVLEAVR